MVEAAAGRLGAAFVARTVHVGAGPDLEARARLARYRVLPPGVLTGHTADDQAETVLVNLLRGAGRDGLAGMRGEGRGRAVRRPLLGLRRADTAVVCAAVGLDPVEDPSNRDRRFPRNRIRHDVLPCSRRPPAGTWYRCWPARPVCWPTSPSCSTPWPARSIPTDARALAAAQPALARRAVRRWLRSRRRRRAATRRRRPRSSGCWRWRPGHAVACELAGGRRVARSAGRLRLSGPASAIRAASAGRGPHGDARQRQRGR